jgi:peptidoglycan/xylan/chitin deacetylase (PgdA/CDA1 family)
MKKSSRRLFVLSFAATLAIGAVVFLIFLLPVYNDETVNAPSGDVDPVIVDNQDYLFERLAPLTDQQPATSTIPGNVIATTTHNVRFDVPFGILMYHHIDHSERFTAKKLSVTPENFEKQLVFLLARGYHFVTLDQAFEYFARDGRAPTHTLVLTFDDGYRSFYTAVFPLLKKYQIPASLYVINQDIGKRGNVTWDMMKEMVKSGLVEIGVHTVNHRPLSKLNEASQRYQLEESKRELEQGLGIEITTVVYPFGRYNSTTLKLVQELGFKGGASVFFGKRPGKSNHYDWRRVQVQNKHQGEDLLRLLYAAFVVVK